MERYSLFTTKKITCTSLVVYNNEANKEGRCFYRTILYCWPGMYTPGQHDSSVNTKTAYKATIQSDFMRIVATKDFSPFCCKYVNFKVQRFYDIQISTTIL
jgi:hypothetical protein